MDYDDNDLHSQNFHLAGEGSAKFPSGLQPYALPKFDFDDSLQSHLRFDSLVETEVFLGIESNQDNHWIEDFSRGSSEIEFNPSAAEPCSISRRNNVWSEATSSESVEMLLKSVGQEEITATPTIIEESDACDELGCLTTKRMEHSLKQDENIISRTEDVKTLENTFPSDEIAGNSTDLTGNVEEDQSCIKDTSQTQGGESFVRGISNSFDKKADGEKGALHLNEEGVFADVKCDDVTRREVHDLPEKHLHVQREEEPFTSSLQSDNLAVPMQNIVTTVIAFSNKDIQLQTSDISSEKPDDHVISKGAEMDNQLVDGHVVHTLGEKLVHLASKVETVPEVSMEVSRCNDEEPCSGSSKGQSDICTVGGSSKDGSFGTTKDGIEDVVMCEDTPDGDDQSKANMLDVPIRDAQFDSGQSLSGLEPSVDYIESSSKNDILKSGKQLDRETLVHTPDTIGSSGDNLSAETHVSATNLAEPILTQEKDRADAETGVYVCNEPVSNSEKENAKVLNACSNMDIDSPVKEVESSSGQDKFDKELSGSELQHATGAGSASDDAFTSSNLVSHATSDGVTVPSEDGVTVEVDEKSSQMSLPISGSNQIEEKEETFTKIFAESNVSSAVVPSNVEAGPGSVSEAEKGTPCDIGGPFLCKTVDQSLPPGHKNAIETLTNAPASTVAEVSEDCTTQITEGDAAEAMVLSDTKATLGNFVQEDDAKDSEPTMDKDKILLPSESLPLVQSHDSREHDQEDNGASSADQSMQVPTSSKLSQIVSLDNGASSAVQNIPIPGSPKLSQSIQGVEDGFKESTKQDISVSKVIDDKAKNKASNSRGPKATDASKEAKTGSSTKSSKGRAGNNLLPLPADLAPRIAEPFPSSTLPGQVDFKIVQDTPQATSQVSEAEISRSRPKSTPERKSRRSSVRATGKDNTKKGTQLKETTPVRQSEKSNNVSLSPPAIFHVMHSNEMQPYGHIDVNNNKPYYVLAASTASLPDLNSSASPSTLFQQPFTDFQQVQLRAQIFVYGALIQGTAPEEAYMLSAFGGLDGGRSLWNNAWQASIERLQSQKSTPIETPLPSRHSTSSVARPADQVSKQSAAQTKGVSTPVGRSTTKSSLSVVSPMIPLSSPLWSMPTPLADTIQSSVLPRGSFIDYQQALTNLHPLQTPPPRNLLGNNTSWMSQSSYRGPWVASTPPSVPEPNARFSAFPPTESVQLTPVKETSVSQSSVKHVPSGPTVQTGAPASVFTTASPLADLKKVTPSHGQQSADPKTRKRKKNSAPEETAQTILQSQPLVQPVLGSVVSNLSTSSAIKTPAPLVSQATSEKLVVPVAPSLLDPLRKPEYDVVQRVILSDDSLNNIKEASKQAEDATALAAAAVAHSQQIWSQLEKQKNSGLVLELDLQAKLASAAVAAAAAAAIARAAAAAANVASSAALQAKLMAEEAFVSNCFGNPSQGVRISSSESGNVLGNATPASILRGEDRGNNTSSILTAAREAARRKVEAASAASKRAENMDAIVKAAELAAEAVSQAGKIVAMGDPLPLSELIEAGPEGYWRTPELVTKSTEMRELSKAGGGGDVTKTSIKHSKGGRSGKKGTQMPTNEQSSIPSDGTTWSENEPVRPIDGISGSVPALEKETRGQKDHKVSDLTKNIVIVLESEPILKSSSFDVENEVENAVQVPKGNNIKEGSTVEVFKNGDEFKAAWYTANVLSLNDGKAYVSYTEIEQNEGSTQLEEWVALAGGGDNPPKIRIARPVTTVQYEGTRKRRRAVIGDYNWTVGDQVDAWMTNSWWEGVVTEKNKKDETSITVHFPAQNETSTVKAWHLRPSLNWKDGEWVEWSNPQHDFSLQEGDIPLEKRLKLGSPAVEVKGKDKISKSSDDLDSAKPEESRLLQLSGIEKTFNVGKSSKSENKPYSTRMVRTGLQKDGSRVVFGVPKPGKKRKFMEVSKHYVADQSNRHDEPGNSIKHLKYSVPQGSRSLRSDPKEKRVAESKLKGLKPGKQQTAFGRTVPQKNFSTNAVSTFDGAADTAKVKDSSGYANMSSRKLNTEEAGSLSNSEGPTEDQFVFSAVAASEGPSLRKIPSTAKTDRANKGKLAPAARKLGKIDEDKVSHDKTVKSTAEAVEPRRSNRRIQPTSRLLEGLQSSLIIPKFPSLSHDKGHRSQSKNISRGNNHG